MNKKGLSTVIATLLLVLLTLVLVGILWNVIGNLVSNKLDDSQNCLNNFGKVTLDSQYTCYNSTSKELQFSINVGDIDLDKVLLGITSQGQRVSLEIATQDKTYSHVKKYNNGTYGQPIRLPLKNGALTYILNTTFYGFTQKPDKLEVAPVVKETQCEVSDEVFEIPNCI